MLVRTKEKVSLKLEGRGRGEWREGRGGREREGRGGEGERGSEGEGERGSEGRGGEGRGMRKLEVR